MSANTIYVIGKIQFLRADDDSLFPGESAIQPSNAFRSKERACEAVDLLTVAELIDSDDLENYGACMSDLFSDLEVMANIVEAYDSDLASLIRDDASASSFHSFGSVVEAMTEHDITLLLEQLLISFYQVYEVELVD